MTRPRLTIAALVAAITLGAALGAWLASRPTSTTVAAPEGRLLSLTPLPDGRALWLGLDAEGAPMASLLDPEHLTWAPRKPPPALNPGHSATALDANRILIVGGQGRGHRAMILHLSLDRTIEVATAPSARAYHTATRLWNGDILLAGGLDPEADDMEASETLEIYDPAKNTWYPAGRMSSPRHLHTATLLNDGRVLIAGGVSPGCCILATADLYDPATGALSPAPDMAHERVSHQAVALPDGRALIIGGATMVGAAAPPLSASELFDPRTNAWTPAAPLPEARCDLGALTLPDGRVLTAGGWWRRPTSGPLRTLTRIQQRLGVDPEGPQRSTALYDPSDDTWSDGPSLNQPHLNPSILLTPRHLLILSPYTAADALSPL